MITLMPSTSSILDSTAKILVVPVNCKGVMGGGVAKLFREKFKHNYVEYRDICLESNLTLGAVFACDDGDKIIFNAATKNHWRDDSSIDVVEKCLYNIRRGLEMYPNAESIAIPALGCGLGGLDWKDVEPLITEFADSVNIDVEIYSPHEQF